MPAKEHGFKAEVQQLLNLMIHSVYSDQEVFVRELISNAADALDKARFVELTDKELTAAGNDPAGIRISVDPEAKVLTLEDDGIGMTADELVQNLGTIAHSGTKAFLEAAGDKDGAPDLIGQFGLGFYSAFIVAEKVEVDTLSATPGAEAARWISEGEGTFSIGSSERDTRGTSIRLFLREDAAEFAEDARIKSVIRKHSNFVAWPIHVGDEQVNNAKALWVEPPSQVTDEDAAAFYKSVCMDWQDPVRRVHVSVDSPIQYTAMLFIPASRPFDLFRPEASRGPRLYARRILIEEHGRDLLPDWLRFVRGVVDSEDISLNVSREMVQKTPVVRKIREGLTKRLLKELSAWANEERAEDDASPSYDDFWKNFGVVLKEGMSQDAMQWGEQITPLLRFNLTSHDDENGLASLKAYKDAMPEGQDAIWYLSAESRQDALQSPHLEAFKKRGWDVLLLTDPVDEWMINALTEFDGTPLKSVSRGELDLDDDTDETDDKADLSEFGPWVKELLGDKVADVRASSRLTDSAMVLVDADDGMSSNMERILRQANQETGMASRRILELNPSHTLIKSLADLKANGKEDEAAELATMLYDGAALLEGHVSEPAAIGRRLQDLLERASRAALG